MLKFRYRFGAAEARMVWVDYVFLAIVLISLLLGALRGFIREALSLASWVAAFVVALRYGPDCMVRLKSLIGSPAIRAVAGYCLPFFGVLLAGGLLILLIGWAVRGAGLAPVDRMLGAGFGLLRGGFIVVVLVMLAGMSAPGRQQWYRQSILVPQIQPVANQLQALIPPHWIAYLEAQTASSSKIIEIQPEK
jgi:membrane protein required for colicin V production